MKKHVISLILIVSLTLSTTVFAIGSRIGSLEAFEQSSQISIKINSDQTLTFIGADKELSLKGYTNDQGRTIVIGNQNELKELVNMLDSIIIDKQSITSPAQVLLLSNGELGIYIDTVFKAFYAMALNSPTKAEPYPDDAYFEYTMEPNGVYTYTIPLRFFLENFYFKVQWDENENTITVTR